MSSSIPGRRAPAPGSDPRSSPVAVVSRSALTGNVRLAVARGCRTYAPDTLEADAWGHGRALTLDVLQAEGLAPAPAPEPAGSDPSSFAVPGRSSVLSGASLFGVPGGAADSVPALRLSGTVLSVKDLRAGEGVSYGYLFRAPTDTRIALITGGYAQGVVRSLGGLIDVSIAGRRHRVVGRVAMDVCVVDVADADVRRGDDALFLGDARLGEPNVGEWARASGLHPAELVTAVGLRAEREVAS